MQPKRRPNSSIVFDALLRGESVDLPEIGEVRLFKEGQEVPWVDEEAIATKTGLRHRFTKDGGEIWLPIELSFGGFIELAEQISLEQRCGIIARFVMQKVMKKC